MSLYNKIKNNITHYQIINLLSKAKDAAEDLNYTGDLTIDTNNYWLKNISKLVNFLKFAGFNEDVVTYESINNFMFNLTSILDEGDEWTEILNEIENNENSNVEKTDFQIFSSGKMAQRSARDIDGAAYDTHLGNILAKPRNTRDLEKALETLQFYKEHPIPRPIKPKKEPFGKDMDKIMPAVLSGRQDIRRIDNAQSVAGAQRWVQKHGFGDIYSVTNEDVDNDGIPDIIVKRKKDNAPIIVNGYTTVDSIYPYRYKYYTAYPTQEERKRYGKGFKGYVSDMWDPVYDKRGMKITQYRNEAAAEKFFKDINEKGGYSKMLKPNSKNVYQLFVSQIIKPLYQFIKGINNGKYPFERKLAEVASRVWANIFVKPAMVGVYGDGINEVDEENYKKLKNRKEVKEICEDQAFVYIDGGLQKLKEFFPLFLLGDELDGNMANDYHTRIITNFNTQIDQLIAQQQEAAQQQPE